MAGFELMAPNQVRLPSALMVGNLCCQPLLCIIGCVDDEPVVLPSALKRVRDGVTEENLLHAYAHQMGHIVDESHPDGPMVLYVGPSTSGVVLLEVGVPANGWHGMTAIVHGMKARPWVLEQVGLAT